jgi:hypothetical protein
MKRIVPKGFLLARPGKQAPVQDSKNIECGTCHTVIYRIEGAFNPEAFEAAKKEHYSVSPQCKPRR